MVDVSLIVPVYNAIKTIERCIQSVLNQTFTNYELILIDDGSSDDTLSICQRYADEYSFIKCYTHDNHGVSYTRNRGIRESSGKYIMFADVSDPVFFFSQWRHVSWKMITNRVYSEGDDQIEKDACCG